MISVAFWRKENRRVIVEVLPDLRKDKNGNYYWKSGVPLDPKKPKMLVRITDKFCQDQYYPTDREFQLIASMMDVESLQLITEGFAVKEKWNISNLKNPESRKIERFLSKS